MTLILWILFSAVVGAFAHDRGHSGARFFLFSILLTPVALGSDGFRVAWVLACLALLLAVLAPAVVNGGSRSAS